MSVLGSFPALLSCTGRDEGMPDSWEAACIHGN